MTSAAVAQTRDDRIDAALSVSFEFFPPGTEKMAQTLWDSLTRLVQPADTQVAAELAAGLQPKISGCPRQSDLGIQKLDTKDLGCYATLAKTTL